MKKQKRNKFLLIIVPILVIFLSSVVFVVVKKYNPNIFSTNTKEKRLPDGTAIQNRSPDVINSSPDKKDNQNNNLSITIAQVTQTEKQLSIKALVGGTTVGSCVLTLKKGSIVITKTTTISQGPSYYYCNGFAIAKTELQKGKWEMNLKAESNGKEGNVSQEVTIE